MMYDIKRGSDIIATVRPDGRQTKALSIGSVVDIVDMTFELPDYVSFEIGDSVDVYGTKYRLHKLPVWTEESTLLYKYSTQFLGHGYELTKVQLLHYNSENELTEPDADIMATAEMIIDLIIANANREQSGWVKGVVDETDTRLLNFSADTCLSTLSKISEEFQIEFWIDGQTINLTRKGVDSGIELAYGEGNGLYNITRNNKDDSSVINRLYAYGSTKNLPANYRGFAKRLKMPVATGAYIEIPQIDPNKIVEHTEYFEDIYPHRTGTVTATADHLHFTDSGIDFNVNDQLLPGIAAKVIFKTGLLAGYEFELNAFSNSTKTFTININKDEKAFAVPSETLKPAIGDTYVLVDLNMPASYILAAEAELQVKAQAYLDKNSIARVVYSVTTDKLHFRDEAISVVLGNTVRLNDIPTGVDVTPRILSYQRDLNDPDLYPAFDVSESVQVSPYVRNYSKQEKIEKAIERNNLLEINKFGGSAFRNRQEILAMIFDPEGNYYSDKIKPLSIETTMLATGAKSQQFQFSGVLFQPNYLGDANHFISSVGVLIHFTIAEIPKTWNISASNYSGLTPSLGYYVYAKCSKVGNTGTIHLTTAQFKVDEDPDYFHFLIGILNSVAADVRGFGQSYGQSTQNGRFLTTGRVQSANGNFYFDLDTGDFFANNATLSGHIEATSGTIAGFTIGTGGFSLNGSAVTIKPNEGISVSGYLVIPSEPSLIPGAMWCGDTGSSGEPPIPGTGGASYLGDLLDVQLTSVLDGQALVKSGGFWKNQNIITDLSSYYTKTQIENFFTGGVSISGYAKSNWDAAYGWGNHAGLYKPIGYEPAYAQNSTRLHASDSPYGYGEGAPYYAYLTYYNQVDRWRLQVSPATPAGIEVEYADFAPWGGIIGSPTNLSQFINDLGNYGSWITGINSGMVTGALGYTPYHAGNPQVNINQWGGLTSNYSSGVQGGGIVSLLGVHTNGTAYGFNASGLQSFLGLGSAAYLNSSQNSDGNTLPQRDVNGYLFNSYFNTTAGGMERNDSDLHYIAGFNSYDTYIRSYNSNAVKLMLGLGSNAYDSTSYLPLSGGQLNGMVSLSNAAYFLGSPAHGYRFNNWDSSFNNFIIHENGDTTTRGAATATKVIATQELIIPTTASTTPGAIYII